MEFLETSSIGFAYQYAIKIEKKFQKKNKQDFGPTNFPQQKHGKGILESQNKGYHKDNHTQGNQSEKGNVNIKDTRNRWKFHKIPQHNIDECFPK